MNDQLNHIVTQEVSSHGLFLPSSYTRVFWPLSSDIAEVKTLRLPALSSSSLSLWLFVKVSLLACLFLAEILWLMVAPSLETLEVFGVSIVLYSSLCANVVKNHCVDSLIAESTPEIASQFPLLKEDTLSYLQAIRLSPKEKQT